MQEQFLDRILTCVDCHGEFIFTAGEQLFFYDKQFKNDPKRCKPCKSRRSGLAAAANGTGPAAAGLSRTETRTQCSECGIETTVPFKPTQGRPVLCRQCFQLKNRAASPLSTSAPIPGAAEALQPSVEAAVLPPATTSARSQEPALVFSASLATPAELAYVAGLNVAPAAAPSSAHLAAQLIATGPPEIHKSAVQGGDSTSTVEAPAA